MCSLRSLCSCVVWFWVSCLVSSVPSQEIDWEERRVGRKTLTCNWYRHCAVQALSKALLELRADMVSQAQSEVLANAEQAAAEINVQRLVDKRTKELQVCSVAYTLSFITPLPQC